MSTDSDSHNHVQQLFAVRQDTSAKIVFMHVPSFGASLYYSGFANPAFKAFDCIVSLLTGGTRSDDYSEIIYFARTDNDEHSNLLRNVPMTDPVGSRFLKRAVVPTVHTQSNQTQFSDDPDDDEPTPKVQIQQDSNNKSFFQFSINKQYSLTGFPFYKRIEDDLLAYLEQIMAIEWKDGQYVPLSNGKTAQSARYLVLVEDRFIMAMGQDDYAQWHDNIQIALQKKLNYIFGNLKSHQIDLVVLCSQQRSEELLCTGRFYYEHPTPEQQPIGLLSGQKYPQLPQFSLDAFDLQQVQIQLQPLCSNYWNIPFAEPVNRQRTDAFHFFFKSNLIDVSDANAENLDTLLQDLHAMIGLQQVKSLVEERINSISVDQLRSDISEKPVCGHYIFTGNPGTGKTTVARKMAALFKALGLLSTGQLVEVKRGDLVAGYSGQTSLKTREKLEEALGGVLFLDEAYDLIHSPEDQFGNEAANEILSFMENHRDNLCIILAGYTNKIERFLANNQGFTSRISQTFEFPDYSQQELMAIFSSSVEKDQFVVQPGLSETIAQVFQHWVQTKKADFGNGRDVRKLYERIRQRQNTRLATTKPQLTEGDSRLYELEVEDLPTEAVESL